MRKKILPWLLVIAAWLLQAAPDLQAATIETRISRDTVQAFVEQVFPVSLIREVSLLGVVSVPVRITLSKPRTTFLNGQSSPQGPFLKIKMDYALTAVGEYPFRGETATEISLAVAEGGEVLVMKPAETYLPLLPFLRISLDSFLKPIPIPLFKTLTIPVGKQKIAARFHQVSMTVEGNNLVVKGDVQFEKIPLPQQVTGTPGDTHDPGQGLHSRDSGDNRLYAGKR